MTYNVHHYRLDDRDNDGQKDDPKPQKEREAVIKLITQEQPDVLALQEMGSQAMLNEFRYALQSAGLTYEHVEFLHRGRRNDNLVVLSRFPIVSRQSHKDDHYSIGEASIPVARGFIDIDIKVGSDYTFRLMVAHLKSKVFHPLGQTEMRRNEARLLNKHIRRSLKENPNLNLLVVGDLNDTYNSSPIRTIAGSRKRYLLDLRPRDYVGDLWTHYSRGSDVYSRIDYTFVSHGMWPEVIPEKCRVVRNPLTHQASDHRPLMVVFIARDKRTPADQTESAHLVP